MVDSLHGNEAGGFAQGTEKDSMVSEERGTCGAELERGGYMLWPNHMTLACGEMLA